MDIPTPTSRLPKILKRLAYKALDHYGWFDAGYSNSHLIEDLIQVGSVVCLMKSSDRIRLDVYNAMGDYILLWYAGVTKNQGERTLKFRVIPGAAPDEVLCDVSAFPKIYNPENQTMVDECICKLKTQISRGPVFNFAALQALCEGKGRATIPRSIMEKYNVTSKQLNGARLRGQKIMEECL